MHMSLRNLSSLSRIVLKLLPIYTASPLKSPYVLSELYHPFYYGVAPAVGLYPDDELSVCDINPSENPEMANI